MRSPKISLVLGLLFLVAGVARADKVTADYDHSVDFSKFKTFMWIHEPEAQDPFMKDRIKRSVNEQLQARGLRLVGDGADLGIGAELATEEKHTLETYYSGSGWGWGGGWATTTERTYQVGTLTVDLFDTRTEEIGLAGRRGRYTLPSSGEEDPGQQQRKSRKCSGSFRHIRSPGCSELHYLGAITRQSRTSDAEHRLRSKHDSIVFTKSVGIAARGQKAIIPAQTHFCHGLTATASSR